MSEMRHTPGPWRLMPTDEVRNPPDPCRTDMFVVAGRGDIIGIVTIAFKRAKKNHAKSHANARLIAAAPDYHELADDLLDALAEILTERETRTGEVDGDLRVIMDRLEATRRLAETGERT